MGQRITIEKWAENLEEVTIGRWAKSLGERIGAGEVLCEIITDKVTFEYIVEEGGTLARIYAAERSVVPVGYVIAFIATAGEAPEPDIEAHNEMLIAQYQERTELDLDLADLLGESGLSTSRVRATPAARRLARLHARR